MEHGRRYRNCRGANRFSYAAFGPVLSSLFAIPLIDQLKNEVQCKALHLATILEPALIVVMGVVVLPIVLAALQTLIQLNQLVR